MFRKIHLYTLLLLLILFGIRAAAQSPNGTFEYDGLTRTYNLHLPSAYDETQPTPLLIALHGFASSGQALAAISGLDAAADAGGFMVVYPNSYGFYWDDGRTEAGLFPVMESLDDAGYLLALIDDLAQSHSVDPARVYLTGINSGGSMAYRLACEAPERFAGLIAISTLMWEYSANNCLTLNESPEPLDVLIVQGSNDIVFPFGGQQIEGAFQPDGTPHRMLSAQQTLDFWRERNGCDMSEVGTAQENELTIYSACEGVKVSYLNVRGAGHSWLRMGGEGAFSLNQFGIDVTQMIADVIAGEVDLQAAHGANLEATRRIIEQWRSYVLYVPTSYDPAAPTPLVIALHGRPGSGTSFAYITDLNKVAEEHGFIVVYPDGLNNEWNYIGDLWGASGYTYDDVGFLVVLARDLSVMLNIDQARLYVTGFSNGGFMTQRVACEAPREFAAFAAVGSAMYIDMTPRCEGAVPAPMLLMHGTDDISIPWNGVMMGPTQQVSLSVPDTLRYWVTHNECDLQSSFTEFPQTDEVTQVVRHTFTNCTNDADVAFYVVSGGGHNWPGVPGRISEQIAGNVTLDINAGEVIWEFFTEHTRNVE